MLGLGNNLARGGVLSGFGNKYSLQFDGDASLEVENHSSLALANEITFSVWAYPTDSGGSQKLIDRGTVYSLWWDQENNKFGFSMERGPNKHVYETGTSSLNTWYHVVGVTSGGASTDGTMVIYVTELGEAFNGDAAVETAALASLGNATVTTDNFFIGSYDGAAYFSGRIDEVAIWNVALSEDDVESIYNSGVPNDLNDSASYNVDRTDALKGWWRMGDSTLDDGNIAGNGLIADQSTPSALGSEELTNGNLETWSDSSSPTGWYEWVGSFSQQSGARTGGGGSYYADCVGAATYQGPSFTSDSGRVYKLEFWYKSTDVPDVSVYDGVSRLLDYTNLLNTSNVWTKSIFYFTGAGNSNTTARWRAFASNNISLDDISIKEVTGNPGMMFNMDSSDIAEVTP